MSNSMIAIGIIFVLGVGGFVWMIRASNKFEKTNTEKKVKDKFKGRDLKRYMKAQDGY